MLLTTFVSHKGWIVAHIILIFTGYAALFLSFGASLLYLAAGAQAQIERSATQPDFISCRRWRSSTRSATARCCSAFRS